MNAPFPPPSVSRAFGHTDAQRRAHARALALAIVYAGARNTAARIVDIRQREHDANVARMVAQPWRITRALFPGRNPAMWPIAGKPATECLADASRMIASQEANRNRGHWTYEPERLRALRQAEAALVLMITGDEPDQPEAA